MVEFMLHRLKLLALIIACLIVFSGSANALKLSDTRYDAMIEKGAKRWMPEYDWRRLKAQYYQESRLEINAVSPVGAKGLAQFMPLTWKEVSKELNLGTAHPFVARYAVHAGAYYMRKQLNGWHDRRTRLSKLKLAQAGYNAGRGHLYKAQKLCGGVVEYDDIIKCLPAVTGRHSHETITYVIRIQRYFNLMEIGRHDR